MEYGLIGYPLKHSFSELIHNLIGKYTNDEYKYELNEIKENELESFMINKDFKAVNVTIPYKEKVIPYLDFVSEEAKEIGAVNLVINKDNKLYGYNTDYFGLIDLIKRKNIIINDRNVLILGTGGTSKTAKTVASHLNAKSISFVSRNKTEYLNYNNVYQKAKEINVVINASPVGMYPNNDEALLDLSKFYHLESYIDVVYNPIHTKNTVYAKNSGINACSGLYMLVSQAYNAYCLFKEKDKQEDIIEKIYWEVKHKLQNIALIGMPSAGKTVVAKELGKILNKEVIDVDSEIEKDINMSISDYFKNFGEAKFRELEANKIKEISMLNGTIISCGGGVVLKKDNVNHLKQNSLIVFIDRDLEKLKPSDNRPLSNNIDDLRRIYNERIDLYKNYADVRVSGNESVEVVAKKVKELCYL